MVLPLFLCSLLLLGFLLGFLLFLLCDSLLLDVLNDQLLVLLRHYAIGSLLADQTEVVESTSEDIERIYSQHKA